MGPRNQVEFPLTRLVPRNELSLKTSPRLVGQTRPMFRRSKIGVKNGFDFRLVQRACTQ